MKTEYVIRDATVADAPAIARVHRQTWLETYAGLIPGIEKSPSEAQRRDMWTRMLPKMVAEEQSTRVVLDGSEIVGFGH